MSLGPPCRLCPSMKMWCFCRLSSPTDLSSLFPTWTRDRRWHACWAGWETFVTFDCVKDLVIMSLKNSMGMKKDSKMRIRAFPVSLFFLFPSSCHCYVNKATQMHSRSVRMVLNRKWFCTDTKVGLFASTWSAYPLVPLDYWSHLMRLHDAQIYYLSAYAGILCKSADKDHSQIIVIHFLAPLKTNAIEFKKKWDYLSLLTIAGIFPLSFQFWYSGKRL